MTVSEKSPAVVRPGFVIGCFAVLNFIIWTATWHYFQLFLPLDPVPDVKRFSTQILHALGGKPERVTVGLIIDSFQNFDVLHNNFIFNGSLWFCFDPRVVSAELLDSVTLVNGTVLERSKPYTQLLGDKLFMEYHIRAKFSSPMSYSGFPYDDHRLSLIIAHPSISAGEMILDCASSDFAVHEDLENSGWQEHSRVVEAGYLESQVQTPYTIIKTVSPAVLFVMNFRRTSMRMLTTLVIPMLLMFLTAMFSFSVPLEAGMKNFRFNFALASISGLIAFRYVIESQSPPGVSYFMISDKLFFLFLAVCVLIFFLHLTARMPILRYAYGMVFSLHMLVGCLYIAILMGSLS